MNQVNVHFYSHPLPPYLVQLILRLHLFTMLDHSLELFFDGVAILPLHILIPVHLRLIGQTSLYDLLFIGLHVHLVS